MPGDVYVKCRAAALLCRMRLPALPSPLSTAAKRSGRRLAVTPYEITATPWREDPKEPPQR
jgi:hypothetical protein